MQFLNIARLAAALLFAQSLSTGQASYTVVNLGKRSHLPNNGAIAISINIRGQVLGQCPLGSCIWDDDGTLVNVPGFVPYATDMNFRGQVVGYVPSGSGLWQGGQITDLSTHGCPGCAAWMINDRGQVIGTFYTHAGTQSQSHAFVWEFGAVTDLGAPGGGESRAYGSNNRGQVAGCVSSPLGDHAVLWDSGKLVDLGLPGPDNCAYGINDRGQVVGWFRPGGNWQPHVFFWDDGDVITLSHPSIDSSSHSAPRINNRGQVVWVDDGHGFIWSAGTVTDLFPVVGSWFLDALSINDGGQIVGTLIDFDEYVLHSKFVFSAVRLDPKDLVPWTPDGSAFSAGGWVQDDVFGMRAAVETPPDLVRDGGNLGIEIRVLENPPNVRIPHVYRPGTFFTDILPIHDSRVPLNPTTQGFALHLPLASPLPVGTRIQLLTPHPFTGKLLPVSSVSGKWVYGTVNASSSAAEFSGIASLSTPFTNFSTFVGLVPSAVLGDVNGDGEVDCTDLGLVKASFGKKIGQPGFNAHADLNDDGIMDLNDLVLVSRQLPTGVPCR